MNQTNDTDRGTAVSESLLKRAERVIPGGVNSPVRAFKSVGGVPRFIDRADGAYLFDADGNRYIDYVLSWGPMILGHRAPVVLQAIGEALELGTSFGAPTELEVEFAELLTASLPGVEMIRLVSSGTEATMSAIRLARGYTNREVILKFNGCYHGHGDSLLVKAGSGVATFGIAGSPGVPECLARNTLSIAFNDLELFERTISEVGADKVAAVIIEPVPGNMGLILPEPGYLEGLRAVCSREGIVLIIDEVMSGFRVAFGGAQEKFGIQGDLVCYGKVIGGGLPVAAFGGRREIMKHLSPTGPIYQAGTLSGNPLAVSVGLAVLRYLQVANPYPRLELLARQWAEGMMTAANDAGVPLLAQSCGSMVGIYFAQTLPKSFEDVAGSDIEMFKKFFHGMLMEGVYLAPSAFEAGFLSTCHTEELLEQTVQAASRVLSNLAR